MVRRRATCHHSTCKTSNVQQLERKKKEGTYKTKKQKEQEARAEAAKAAMLAAGLEGKQAQGGRCCAALSRRRASQPRQLSGLVGSTAVLLLSVPGFFCFFWGGGSFLLFVFLQLLALETIHPPLYT